MINDFVNEATKNLADKEKIDEKSLKVQEVNVLPDPGKRKWKIHIIWGYNRSWHASSTSTWTTNNGTFKIHDAKAKDRPTPLGWVYVDPSKFSIPQYNYRIGMEKENKKGNGSFGFELGMDHMKWVFEHDQAHTLTGEYDAPLYRKDSEGKITEVSFDQLKQDNDASPFAFEYSDGHNYAHLSAFYNINAFETTNKKFKASFGIEGGSGAYIPRPHVKIFSQNGWHEGENGKFQVAGYGFHLGAKSRLTFFDKFFIESSIRGIGIKSKATIYSPEPITIEQDLMKSVQVYTGIGFVIKNFNK